MILRLLLTLLVSVWAVTAQATSLTINNTVDDAVSPGVGNTMVSLGTCFSGESACIGTSPNSYMMVTGSVTRATVFSSVTSATTSAVTSAAIGPKTFIAQIINGTSETKAATLTIYGNLISSTTGGIALCTITLPSTATVLQLQDSCPVTTVSFPYYFYTATVYTSASSAPLTVYAIY